MPKGIVLITLVFLDLGFALLSGCNQEGDGDGQPNSAPQASPITLQAGALPYIEQRLIGTDPDNDTLTFELQAPPSGTGYANAYLNPTSGMLFVTLVSGFSGAISLSYRVTDGRQFSLSAAVQIQVPTAPAGDNRLGSQSVDPRMYAGFAIDFLAGAVLGTPPAAPSRPARIDLSADFPVAGAQHLHLNPMFDDMKHLELLVQEVMPQL